MRDDIRPQGNTHRIPSLGGGEAIRTATGVVPLGDIVERPRPKLVQEWVQEPQRFASIVENGVVQQRDKAPHSRTCSARARYGHCLPAADDLEVLCLRCDVRESAA